MVFFDASLEIVYFLTLTGSLLTFGVVFPPLSVAMVALGCTARHVCDRFLLQHVTMMMMMTTTTTTSSSSSRRLVEVDALAHDCRGAINQSMIRNSSWVIIGCSSCFYSLFLFDMLGNGVNYKQAFWIVIVTALSPLCLYAVEVACRRGRRSYDKWKMAEEGKGRNKQKNSIDIDIGSGVAAVELSVAQSPLSMPP